jgi:hypothetical protein
MNAIAERWTGECRHELLDRTLIWNENHLRRILCEYETHHNQRRPHRSLDSAAPLKRYPNQSILSSTVSEDTLASAAWSTNIAWSHDVDEVLGTHSRCGDRQAVAVSVVHRRPELFGLVSGSRGPIGCAAIIHRS